MTTFNNTISHFNGSTLKTESFETRKEAKKGARKLAKELNLIKHAGHTVNYSEHIELITNY